MKRSVRGGLIQASNPLNDTALDLSEVRQAMVDKHLTLIDEAGKKDVQILCLQELFNTPYYCPSKDRRWLDLAEPIPGPTTDMMAKIAALHHMVIIVPLCEKENDLYYNTAAVLDADGTYLGKYRKNHIPHIAGFWEKSFFTPGNLGYPVFKTAYATIGVYICYDRHFPEGARLLGLAGAEIVFNPSATVAGLSEHLWSIEQPAHAVANGYFMGCSNRVGTEAPWNIGEFYGSSYFVNPKGQSIIQASRDKDELIIADMDLSEIEEAHRTWPFFNDRRPESYHSISMKKP